MGDRAVSSISPFFIDVSLQSPELRAALSTAFAPSTSSTMLVEGGVLPNPNNSWLSVTSTGTTSAPQVTAAPGKCVAPYAAQYGYEATFPTALTVPLSPPPATNPRVDLVVARVYGGAETGDGFSGAYIETIDGTPSGTPVAPALPVGAIPLAEALVATTGVVTITDRRTYTRTAGGVRKSDNNTDAPGAWPADLRISPTGVLDSFVNGSWTTLATPAVWSQFNPTLQYAGGSGGTVDLGSTGSVTARYVQIGKRLDLAYTFISGGTGINFGYGSLFTTLPPGLLSRNLGETHIPLLVFCTTSTGAANGTFAGMAYIPTNSNTMVLRAPTAQDNCILANLSNALVSGGTGTGVPERPGHRTFEGPGCVISIAGTIEVQ